MNASDRHLRRTCYTALLLVPLALHARGEPPSTSPPEPRALTAADAQLAATLAAIIREAIPREYAREKDWGKTKRITTGITTDEPIYKLKLHRRKKEVPHGTWKKYRVEFIEPEKRLHVSVQNLHSLEGGGIGLRLVLDAELDGWAQMRHYNRGVHLLTLTAEGDSHLRVAVDCQVRLKMTADGLAIQPQVVGTQLDIKEFELRRFGELEGDLAEELGDGLLYLMRDQLEDKQLTAKLNRAIDKKRDRFVVTAGDLVPEW